ncbi:MAG: gamma-glutamylcyclotransferase family protein [Cyanobacteria bacterium P01_D01_bin.56]
MEATIDVFVYGTLKPGGTYHQQYCAPYLQTSRPAQVRGRLYDLPALGYPVMTPGEGWVQGFWFRLAAIALPGLDYLEGYIPPEQKLSDANNDTEEEYIRQQTTVFDLEDKPIGAAWIYVMDAPPDEAIWLPHGEWEIRS